MRLSCILPSRPYMIMTGCSMAELKRKMNDDNFGITQFRPNLVVKTDSGEPFQVRILYELLMG